MTGYVKPDDLAKLWDISTRQVQYLCKHGRIEGVIKFGNTWAIPENAKKPTRTGKYKPGRIVKSVASNKHMDMEQIVKGSLTLDLLSNRTILNGNDLELYQKEFDVLFFLAQNEGKPFSAEELYAKIWARPMSGDKGAVQATISRLRKSLAPCEYGIVTRRGEGYVFTNLTNL